jgi:heme exporter protein A
MIRGLRISGLALARGDRLLFEDLNMTVTAGEAVALTGANGAGKTSLLRAIAGFLRPVAGEITFDTELEPEEARSKGLHMLGHQDGLKTGRKAWEELLFQTLWTGGAEAAARGAVERLSLSPLLNLEVRKLSAGQRRRLALARLIASPRSVWLLDEPMAPLDTERRTLFGALMNEHLEDGGIIIAAVHDPLPIKVRAVEVKA